MQNQIPKVIHYVWVGKDKNGNRNKKSDIILKCLKSWQTNMLDWEIKEWNEDNFDIYANEYTKEAYQNKKWAFVADYIRLYVLYKEGGVYLDTDMYIVKSLDDILNYELVLGKEDNKHISAGMIASVKNNIYIKDLIENYNNIENKKLLQTIPKIMTEVFNKNKYIYDNIQMKYKIFDPIYFYPFEANKIKSFIKSGFALAPQTSYAVHLWEYSWGHPLNKFVKKIGLYRAIKYTIEKVGLKKIIKKTLKME